MAKGKRGAPARRTTQKKKVKLTIEKQLYIILGLLVVLFVLILISRCAIPVKTGMSGAVAGGTTAVESLEMPRVEERQFVLDNTAGRYTIYYDTAYRQAAWVAYVLTRHDVETKGANRGNRFVTDVTVKDKGWPYSVDSDYAHSGYDRGHLVPSADRNDTRQENDATFLLSNISPQRPGLNRKIWNSLESEVRRMAEKFDTVYVVTGGELKPGLKRIGRNGVGVPERFFKVLLAKKGGEYMSVAFVIPNRDSFTGGCWDYAVSVNEAEELLGYDFFYNLPDSFEEKVEAEINIRDWR